MYFRDRDPKNDFSFSKQSFPFLNTLCCLALHLISFLMSGLPLLDVYSLEHGLCLEESVKYTLRKGCCWAGSRKGCLWSSC